MRRLGALAALCAAALLSGCTGIKAPDLFVVYRSGNVPGAKLTVLVNEEGGVTCNGGKVLKLSDHQIIVAREIQEDLETPSSHRTSLPPRAGSVFSYYVRDEKGSVRFSDNSTSQPKAFHRLTLLVLEIAQGICHLPT